MWAGTDRVQCIGTLGQTLMWYLSTTLSSINPARAGRCASESGSSSCRCQLRTKYEVIVNAMYFVLVSSVNQAGFERATSRCYFTLIDWHMQAPQVPGTGPTGPRPFNPFGTHGFITMQRTTPKRHLVSRLLRRRAFSLASAYALKSNPRHHQSIDVLGLGPF